MIPRGLKQHMGKFEIRYLIGLHKSFGGPDIGLKEGPSVYLDECSIDPIQLNIHGHYRCTDGKFNIELRLAAAFGG